jgi:hypothetical protein
MICLGFDMANSDGWNAGHVRMEGCSQSEINGLPGKPPKHSEAAAHLEVVKDHVVHLSSHLNPSGASAAHHERQQPLALLLRSLQSATQANTQRRVGQDICCGTHRHTDCLAAGPTRTPGSG